MEGRDYKEMFVQFFAVELIYDKMQGFNRNVGI